MSAVVKGGLLVIGLGAVGVGGWGVNLVINKEPKAYTLDSEEAKTGTTNTSTYTANTTIGGKNENKKILVANIPKNEDWFNWVYKNKLEPIKNDTGKNSNLDSEFSAVTQGYSMSTDDAASKTALNKVCDSFYKKGKNDFTNDTGNKKQNNIKEFCTVGGDKAIIIPST